MYKNEKIRIAAIISEYCRVRGEFPFLITLNTFTLTRIFFLKELKNLLPFRFSYEVTKLKKIP